MKRFREFYGMIARPWICVLTYLWLLELQAVYGNDFEPLLDSLADASAILWTLVFWIAVICAAILPAGLMWSRSTLSAVNQRLSRIACLVISGIFFLRWINASVLLSNVSLSIYILTVILVATVYVTIRRRRMKGLKSRSLDLPSWDDCFFIGVVPLFLVSVVIMVAKIQPYDTGKALRRVASAKEQTETTRTGVASPNVILVVSDSLRAESMSIYGNQAVPTPGLARLAQTSSLYLDTHANGTMTVPSMTALLTGKHPLIHGRLSREIPVRVDRENLLRLLRRYGYETAAVTSNIGAALGALGFAADLSYPENRAFMFLTLDWLRDLGVHPTLMGGRMYEELSTFFPFLGYPLGTSPYGNVKVTLSRAAQIVPRLKEPYFLLIHIHEPHESEALQTISGFIHLLVNALWLKTSSGVGYYAYYDRTLQPLVDDYRSRYERLVRAVDTEMDKFLRSLEQRSAAGNTLLIFTGDHGESFERGYLNHGEELYENSTRVPLIIRFPGQKSGERVSGFTETIDIAPTILRALKIPVPDWMGGQPLEPESHPDLRATITINFRHPEGNAFYPLPTKLAVWWDRYKLIVPCAAGDAELFDLVTDPEERMNLANWRPDLVRRLKSTLAAQMAKQMHEPKLHCPNI
jgi:hypothetical protein